MKRCNMAVKEMKQKLSNTGVSNAGFKILYGLQMFYEKSMHSTHLLDLNDTHNVFWSVKLKVNITLLDRTASLTWI